MKNKFIAIFAGLTMLASMTAVSAAEAVNGEVAGNCPDGIKFVLSADSTETNKIVDIFYFGEELSNLESYSFKVSVPSDVTPVYTSAFDGSITNESKAGLLNIVETAIATTAWNADKKVGSFTLATAEGHGELRVELTELDMYATNFDPDTYAGNVYYDGTGEFDNGDASWLVIPAWSTGDVDTRADFEAVPATEVGTYVDDTTSVPVKAWVASIDYEVEKLAEGAKLAWAVEGASKTIETGKDTTVSGEGVVFYGFAVAGRADELATIGTVTLVAE